jgi:hypothetical protein
MAICKDCIAAGVRAPAAVTPPCEGLTFTLVDAGGRTETATAVTRDNSLSVIGYDIEFDFGGKTFSVVYSAPNWLILDVNGTKVWGSAATGTNNNSCPPTSGWADVSGGRIFSSVGVDYITAPGPSGACTVSNGTFDSNSTGWTVTNGAWNGVFGGVLLFDNALLGSLSQANVLTVGETYTISLDYSTSTRAGYCTPVQLDQAYIKIYAGTKVYTHPLDDVSGGFKPLEVELTCEGNTTLKVEVFDPNQCYGSITGGKGRAIDNVCAVKTTIVTDPTGEDSPLPAVEFRDMAEVPAQVNGRDYNTKLSQYQECLAVKGTTFYNKVIGGVKCDYRELSKLKLIIELLGQKSIDRALDCIYDRSEFPTVLYPDIPCNLTIPFIDGGSTTITLSGDYSQFETFTFEVTSPAGYAIASGPIIFFTNPGYFYTNPGAIPFNPIGYYYALSNSLAIQPIDDNAPLDVFNPLPINNFQEDAPLLPSGVGDIVYSATVISEFGLLTPANGTIYTIYDPAAVTSGGETFTTTIINAVYDPITNTTTLLLLDPFPGDAVGSTLCLTQNKENTNDYLETFVNFANRFCADCIVTGPAPTPTTPVTPSLGLRTSSLGGETGIPLTTEFNQKIII